MRRCVVCSSCGGGGVDDNFVSCNTCDGTGEMYIVDDDCGYCSGTGYDSSDGGQCNHCDGEG